MASAIPTTMGMTQRARVSFSQPPHHWRPMHQRLLSPGKDCHPASQNHEINQPCQLYRDWSKIVRCGDGETEKAIIRDVVHPKFRVTSACHEVSSHVPTLDFDYGVVAIVCFNHVIPSILSLGIFPEILTSEKPNTYLVGGIIEHRA